ncbi:MAG: NAD(P)-dependent oxidoreductase [Okeania sp. SIO2C9]|uniref:NAD(P)-dependent oxidoreductase n=1 Tax=Okeania sp. SIO2C9 TaxID=2607791 RepID=UPI0013BF73CF|nr:NAD(P)-dependent oxidoreductase [Okeania sp. SIO2C9]NEQ76221.1 NAD(P)-dependent oxidoreductase [Okeania sp. SIO2C9]
MKNKSAVAYIGTGYMGRPMILRLLELGYRVQVYDKYPKAAKTVIEAGAVWCNSPKEVAQDADIVITNLPLPHHVTENMLGENGALTGMKSGSTWIDFSTTDYHNTQYIAKEAKKKGIYSLEAPVSNLSHMGVDFGNISFYVSGDREGFDISQEVLNGIGKISFFVMNKIGEAQAVKLLTNLLCYTGIVILGEVLVIAKKHDIPLDWMWEFIKASQGNSFAAEQISPFIFDGSYDHSCSLEIAVKDTDLTLKLAEELNVSLPLGKIIEARYRQVGEKYKSSDNYIIVAKLVEDENNLDLRIPGFTAPSPYGLDRNYVYSGEFVKDALGRVKPHPYQFNYDRPKQKLQDNLEKISQTLTEFMAYINYLILQESYQLGQNMGLTQDLLVDVIRWGCGSSWVSDNENSYQPNDRIVTKFKDYNFDQKVKIPTINKIIALLEK